MYETKQKHEEKYRTMQWVHVSVGVYEKKDTPTQREGKYEACKCSSFLCCYSGKGEYKT